MFLVVCHGSPWLVIKFSRQNAGFAQFVFCLLSLVLFSKFFMKQDLFLF